MIQKKLPTISIIGLGTIGLPTACMFLKSGYTVNGIDTSQSRIEDIQCLNIEGLEDIFFNVIQDGLNTKYFRLSSSIQKADIYIIAVPTFANEKGLCLQHIDGVLEQLSLFLDQSSLVILESTCPIGTLQNIRKKLDKQAIQCDLAYCPERVYPGNIYDEMIHNNKVIGADDGKSHSRAKELYKTFVQAEIACVSSKCAEAVKLIENTYRFVNIALSNEVDSILKDHDIDANETIKLANMHPRVNYLAPGIGIGGNCLETSTRMLSQSNFIVKASLEANKERIDRCVDTIAGAFNQVQHMGILCLGYTYKANHPSIANSIAVKIIDRVKNTIKIPNVDVIDPLANIGKPLQSYPIQNMLVVLLVPHKIFIKDPIIIEYKDKIINLTNETL